MSIEELRTIISVAALIASAISLYFTRRFWLQSNRPIITAFVDEHSSGNVSTTFNLVVSNTGNRPAVNIRLYASNTDLESLLDKEATKSHVDEVINCFSKESTITILRNGEELTTAFGAFSGDQSVGKWLNYGAQISIIVTYEDLDRRSYKAHMPLKIYARHGFAGAIWGSNSSK